MNAPKPPSAARQQPVIGMWLGNFFEPFFSDRDAVRAGVAEIGAMGFNAINLDSKPWEDFFARYRGEPASPYVAMHEFLMEQAAAHGLQWTHLAVYLCGDNLYPNIRDVPPVRGEDAIAVDGRSMGTYKYWSPKAQQSMLEHVQGLTRLYAHGVCRQPGTGALVTQTMFDPIAKPSFDEEGRTRYLRWLNKRHGGDIARLNRLYGLQVSSFEALEPHQYWLRPDELNWVGCATPTAEDFQARSPDFHRWVDNQCWLAEVMEQHFATMKPQWHALPQPLHVEPLLHQWGYFFNPPGQADWATGKRALDVWRIAPHVDGVLYITAPLNPEDRPDPMPVSVEGAILRSANTGRDGFKAGLYLGRHVNGDIYRQVPASECIATLVAAGATSLHTYGYSGLDDGGVLYRMDATFKDDLARGVRWAREVIPLLQEPRTRQVALVFPREMSLLEPGLIDPEGRHHLDLLGWYNQFIDLGWQVDILHPDQVTAGALTDYALCAVPHNSLYDSTPLGDHAALEESVRSWVHGGGTLFHGAHCGLAVSAFGLREQDVPFDCIDWDEQVIPHGWSTTAYEGGEALGRYIERGQAAITRRPCGQGRVISLGFEYGYAYARRTTPIVPPRYGKREMHPIVLLKRTPVQALAGMASGTPLAPRSGLEMARFGSRWLLINHRSTPLPLTDGAGSTHHPLQPCAAGWLAGHSAVVVDT